LVTGSPRSGSTWVGQVLAAAPDTGYIHEPFNIGFKLGHTTKSFEYWFQDICEENSNQYEEMLSNVFQYKYPLGSNIAKIKTVRNVTRIIRGHGAFLYHKIRKDTPIVKYPIALFSADWLSETFNKDVLVIIRHPAAFCSSMKIKEWKIDFNNFLEQPLLMNKYLGIFEEEIREYAENEADIINQAILLWNCIYHTVSIFQEKHSEWLFVRHEDLSLDPINQFQAIYQAFNLDLTLEVSSFILEVSGAHNPIEQQFTNEFRRNSKENVFNWKNRLSLNEIDKIKEKTSKVSNRFYAEHEW